MPVSATLFCNPLLDLILTVDEEWESKYKLLRDGYSMYNEEVHRGLYEELMDAEDTIKLPGGSGQNTARMMKAVLHEKGNVSFFGCVGADPETGKLDKYAECMRERALAEGVLVNYDSTTVQPSGTCAVCILGGKRSLVTNIAATAYFLRNQTPDYLKTLWSSVGDSAILFISGFFITANAEIMLEVAERCTGDQLLVVSLSAPFIIENFFPEVQRCFKKASIVVGNSEEWLTYARVSGLSDADTPGGTAELLRTALVRCVDGRRCVAICTRDEDPVYVATAHMFIEVPVTAVAGHEIVDTNGCGDAFIGGVMAMIAAAANPLAYFSEVTSDPAKLAGLVHFGNECAASVLRCHGFDIRPNLIPELPNSAEAAHTVIPNPA